MPTTCTIYLNDATDLRLVRGLVGRALVGCFGRDWKRNRNGEYIGKRFALADGDTSGARFYVDCTGEEFQLLNDVLVLMARSEGWEFLPFDCYHD